MIPQELQQVFFENTRDFMRNMSSAVSDLAILTKELPGTLDDGDIYTHWLGHRQQIVNKEYVQRADGSNWTIVRFLDMETYVGLVDCAQKVGVSFLIDSQREGIRYFDEVPIGAPPSHAGAPQTPSAPSSYGTPPNVPPQQKQAQGGSYTMSDTQKKLYYYLLDRAKKNHLKTPIAWIQESGYTEQDVNVVVNAPFNSHLSIQQMTLQGQMQNCVVWDTSVKNP